MIVIIAAISLWRRKVKYNVDKSDRGTLIGDVAYNTDASNPYATGFPKEGKKKTKHLKFHDTSKRFSMGMADVDPLSQFNSQLNSQPVDIGEPLGEAEEEEHNIDLGDAKPGVLELEQENNPVCY